LEPGQEHGAGVAKDDAMAFLKVSTRSNPNAVAGAFAGVVREQGRVEVQVVGAGALNQAIKAVAIARSMLAAQGIDLICAPSFAEIEIDGQPRTAMQLVVERRDQQAPFIAVDPQLSQAAAVADLRVETTADGVTVTTEADASVTPGSPPGTTASPDAVARPLVTHPVL
jgi:stage V sporulation protein S